MLPARFAFGGRWGHRPLRQGCDGFVGAGVLTGPAFRCGVSFVVGHDDPAGHWLLLRGSCRRRRLRGWPGCKTTPPGRWGHRPLRQGCDGFVGAGVLTGPAFRRGVSFIVGLDDPAGHWLPLRGSCRRRRLREGPERKNTPNTHPHPSFALQMPPSPWEGEGHPGSGVSPHPSGLRPATFPQGKALGGGRQVAAPTWP